MPIAEDKLYTEIGQNWLHYVSWREKIFAGYLTVLAALAYAFSQNINSAVRCAVFAFGFLVSVVFRILDFRTTELVNLCQVAGDDLAVSKGFYGALNRLRFEHSPSRHRLWIALVSYGLAINVLVASVSAASVVGFAVSIQRWLGGMETPVSPVKWWWSQIALALAFVIFVLLQWLTHGAWSREQKRYRSASKDR
jgi:hypothetical protein